MMNAIEFDSSFAGALRATVEFATPPGRLHRLYAFMPMMRRHLEIASGASKVHARICSASVSAVGARSRDSHFPTANSNRW